MKLESKIKLRGYGYAIAAFAVLAWLIGITYALLTALLAFLAWKAYEWAKMVRWWKTQTPFMRQMSEYIASSLNEGERSKNLWIRSLVVPEMAEYAVEYHATLMAREAVIEKQYKNPVEGWTEWGATRVDEYVIQPASENGEILSDNVGVEGSPIPLGAVLVFRAAFETMVAEYALKLLGVPNPRAAITQRIMSKLLEEQNTMSRAGSAGQLLVASARHQMHTTALRLLARALGEPAKQTA